MFVFLFISVNALLNAPLYITNISTFTSTAPYLPQNDDSRTLIAKVALNQPPGGTFTYDIFSYGQGRCNKGSGLSIAGKNGLLYMKNIAMCYSYDMSILIPNELSLTLDDVHVLQGK